MEAKIIRKPTDSLRILGNGDLKVALKVSAQHFSEGAKAKIEAAGGTVIPVTESEPKTGKRDKRVQRSIVKKAAEMLKAAEREEAAALKRKRKRRNRAAEKKAPQPKKAKAAAAVAAKLKAAAAVRTRAGTKPSRRKIKSATQEIALAAKDKKNRPKVLPAPLSARRFSSFLMTRASVSAFGYDHICG